jgi:ribosome-associated heat shock protein Hsp15
MRIDKWLWAVRLYKTRTLANNCIRTGKVKLNGSTTKPAGNILVGQEVTIKKAGVNFTFRVERLIEKRVGAPVAVTCYKDITPQAEKDKFKEWYYAESGGEFRDRGAGRPTKKDRREIDGFKDSDYVDSWEELFDEADVE